jgi:hypothetical protein
VERQKVIEQRCELQVMSEVQKQQQHPIPLRLEAQLKSKNASLPTWLDDGGAGNAVKGQDERLKPGALDCVSSADALVRSFYT